MPRRALGPATFAIIILTAVAACGASGAATPPPSTPVASPSPSAAALETTQPPPSAAPETPAPSDTAEPSRSHKPLPSIDQSELDAYLTSSITLLNLADADLSVAAAYVDSSSGEAIDFGTYELGTNEQQSYQVPPGSYKLTFRLAGSAAKAQTCNLTVADKDTYTFAQMTDAVAVTTTGAAPKKTSELFVATASLCGH